MNASIDLRKPERRDLKRPEAPEILLTVSESDLLFWCWIKILSSRMTWESVLNILFAHTPMEWYLSIPSQRHLELQI